MTDSFTELRPRFDAVVMLTWSNWKTEPRSNRYHYASRFACSLPVLFVQDDAPAGECYCEGTGDPNFVLIHVPHTDAGRAEQSRLLARVLRDRGIAHPLLWIYNSRFHHFVVSCNAPLKVYHATEDYFGADTWRGIAPSFLAELKEMLSRCHALVAVSEGVKESYVVHGEFRGSCLVATNACDYHFYARKQSTRPAVDDVPIAIFSGGINYRLDFPLLLELTRRLPEWQFHFCGKVYFGGEHGSQQKLWDKLARRANVAYLGNLEPESLREALHGATVGLIPFLPLPTIAKRSFPLKAFEYVACGLPVVSTPIDDLRRWPELFTFAESGEQFATALRDAAPRRYDSALLAQRSAAARAQSYDEKFTQVQRFLVDLCTERNAIPEAENVLVLVDRSHALDPEKQSTLAELRNQAAPCNVYFAPATGAVECPYDFFAFDTILIHPSVRLGDGANLAPAFATALRDCLARKILLVDDLDALAPDVRRAQRELGIQEIRAANTPALHLFRPGPLAKLPRPLLNLLEVRSTQTSPAVATKKPPRPVGVLRKVWRRFPEWLRRPLRPSLWTARAFARTLIS
jgi:glycosyltransferase involved in cell wall biosynthesis